MFCAKIIKKMAWGVTEFVGNYLMIEDNSGRTKDKNEGQEKSSWS